MPSLNQQKSGTHEPKYYFYAANITRTPVNGKITYIN